MITAALNGELDNVKYTEDLVFGLSIPVEVPNVPSEILIPRNTWADKAAYDEKAEGLAQEFAENFEQFEAYANEEIMSGAPRVAQTV
jgi:phosphoenolpyruvate carboxykinase (ATP)